VVEVFWDMVCGGWNGRRSLGWRMKLETLTWPSSKNKRA